MLYYDCTYFRKHFETERKFEFLNSISYILRNIFKHLNKRFPRLIIVGRSVCNNIIVAKYDKIWLCSKVSQNFNSNPRLAKENIAARSPDGVLGLEAEEEGWGEVSDILDTLLVAGGSDRLQVAVEEGHEVPASTGSFHKLANSDNRNMFNYRCIDVLSDKSK